MVAARDMNDAISAAEVKERGEAMETSFKAKKSSTRRVTMKVFFFFFQCKFRIPVMIMQNIDVCSMPKYTLCRALVEVLGRYFGWVQTSKRIQDQGPEQAVKVCKSFESYRLQDRKKCSS